MAPFNVGILQKTVAVRSFEIVNYVVNELKSTPRLLITHRGLFQLPPPSHLSTSWPIKQEILCQTKFKNNMIRKLSPIQEYQKRETI